MVGLSLELGLGFSSRQAGVDPDASAYFTAVEDAGGSIGASEQGAFDRLAKNLKSNSLWDKVPHILPHKGPDFAGLFVPFKGGASLTNNNFVSGDYDADVGLTGTGSEYIATDINADALDKEDSGVFALHVGGTPGLRDCMIGSERTTNSGRLSVQCSDNDASDYSTNVHSDGITTDALEFTNEFQVSNSPNFVYGGRNSSTACVGLVNADLVEDLSSDVEAASSDHFLHCFAMARYDGAGGLNTITNQFVGTLAMTGVTDYLNETQAKALRKILWQWCVEIRNDINIQGFHDDAIYYLFRGSGSGTISQYQANLINNFYNTIDDGGVLAKVEQAGILMGWSSLEAALTPLFPNTSTPVNTNFVSGDYSSIGGLTGNGTDKTIATGYNCDGLANDSAHLGIYTTTDGGENAYEAAANQSSLQRLTLQISPFGTQSFFDCFNTSTGRVQLTHNDITGFMLGNRISGVGTIYDDGVALGIDASGGGASPNQELFIFSFNGTGGFSSRTMQFWTVGDGLTDVEAGVYNDAVNTLIFGLAFGENYPGFEAETQSYLQRGFKVGGTLSSANATAVNVAISSLKSQSLWSKIYDALILAGWSKKEAALLGIKGNFDVVNNNFVDGDYGATTGLDGDGSTKYLNSGVTCAAAASADTNNHLCVHYVGSPAGGDAAIGGQSGVDDNWVIGTDSVTRNLSNTDVLSPTITTDNFVVLTRGDDTEAIYYADNQTLTQTAPTDGQLADCGNLYIFDRDAGSRPLNGALAWASSGDDLSAADVIAYKSTVKTLLTSLGVI